MARPKTRETYGNGSVTPQKDKSGKQMRDKNGELIWRVCVSLGYETYVDDKGNRRRKQRKVQRVVHGTLADARAVVKQLTEEYENIEPASAKNSFKSLVNAWVTSMRNANTCSPNKLKDYETRLGYVADQLGDKPVIEVKRQDVEDALAAIRAERNVSQCTLRNIFALTKRVFEYGIKSDWLVRNPCASMDAPRVTGTVERRSLTSDECAELRKCLDRDEAQAYVDFQEKECRQEGHHNLEGRSKLNGLSTISGLIAVRIMLATGCRRGESLALTWADVDLDNATITIRRSLNSAMVLKEPKTAKGVRSLAVDGATIDHLRKWKDFQAKALKLIDVDLESGETASMQTEDTPICCNGAGKWLNPRNLERWWGTTQEIGYRHSIGFDDLRLHELRHTQATQLIGAGVDFKTVQTRLGHADVSLTINTYTHAIPANDREAANLIASITGASSAPAVDSDAANIKRTA